MKALKRRFPVFSIRTLLVVMTLFCAYAACWWPTKTGGVRDVSQYWNAARTGPHAGLEPIGEPAVIAPLVVRQDIAELPWFSKRQPRSRYYFWFFGYIAKLPYEQTLPADQADDLLLKYFEETEAYFLESVDAQEALRDRMVVEEVADEP